GVGPNAPDLLGEMMHDSIEGFRSLFL
ncbi:MAG: hypothetical protein ACI9F9_003244, partial [Candidatus Paceibacteria bacterium]